MKSKLIRQHNAISMARYEMSAMEKNIVYLLMANIKEEDVSKVYTVSLRGMEKYTGKNIDHIHFRRSSNLLVNRVFGIDIEKKGYIDMNVFLSAEYVKEEGSIRLELSKEVHGLFTQLKRNFTTFQLETALSLRSKHAKRIYEMLSQFKDTSYMRISIKALKDRLGVGEKYAEFGMFRKKVLEIAKKQINDNVVSDIFIDYQAIKTGKKYTHLHFQIKQKQKRKKTLLKPLAGQEKTMQRLQEKFKLSAWQVKRVIQEVPIKELHKELYDIELHIVSGKIQNIGGYVAKRLDQKFHLQLFSIKKS